MNCICSWKEVPGIEDLLQIGLDTGFCVCGSDPSTQLFLVASSLGG